MISRRRDCWTLSTMSEGSEISWFSSYLSDSPWKLPLLQYSPLRGPQALILGSYFIYKLIHATLFTPCYTSTTALVCCLLSQICVSSPSLASRTQICVSQLPDRQQTLDVSKAPETPCNQNILDPNSISAPSIQFKS